MTHKEYAEFVETTWISEENPRVELARITLGLCDESGEVAGKIKKELRGDEPDDYGLLKEMGDALYYFTILMNRKNFTLEEIMGVNAAKLSDRKERGVIQGSGDNR
jgi:phosphoribosyl-ATP pyrophosphohydrolase